MINVTKNREVEIFCGNPQGRKNQEFEALNSRPRDEAEEEKEAESLAPSSAPQITRQPPPHRIDSMDLFSAEELQNFSDLLPSGQIPSITMTKTQSGEGGQEEQAEDIGEVKGSTEQYEQTALSKMNAFFNQQIDFD